MEDREEVDLAERQIAATESTAKKLNNIDTTLTVGLFVFIGAIAFILNVLHNIAAALG